MSDALGPSLSAVGQRLVVSDALCLGVGEFLLDLGHVLGCEPAPHFTERPTRFTKLQGAAVEIDADEAHHWEPSTRPSDEREALAQPCDGS